MNRHGLDERVSAWVRAFCGESVSVGAQGAHVVDWDLTYGFLRRGRDWRITLSERGAPPAVLVTGEREHVQRHWVWTLAATAQTSAGRSGLEYPIAPERVPADGPLQVRDGADGPGAVWTEGRRVALFASRSEAVEFTHYGHLPVELLIAQIESPSEEMIFPAGARYRTDEEQAEEAARIRRGVLALLDRTG